MARMLTAPPNQALDALLELICLKIQLSKTQDERARGHYDAVTRWLAREDSPLVEFHPHIFPQGSQRLGTTTKPVRYSEFDLDAVCKFDVGGTCHPGQVYRLIWDRLENHETYRPMMKRMPRCIRLEYAGDFHLDIAPGIQDPSHGGNCILVPDLDANLSLEHPENDRWKSTNPMDYADWFDRRCRQQFVVQEKYARAQVDPVPETEPVHAKPSLKRSVQLFKRWRDVEYSDRPSLAPPSIILTTLSGHFYDGEPLCSNALQRVLESTARWIESGERICLTNPAHDEENICEKWDNNPAAYRDFTIAVTEFFDRWENIRNLRGLPAIEEELTSLFGESPVQWAVKEFAERRFVTPRGNRSLRVDPSNGVIVPAAAAIGALSVPPNTFHGD